MEWLLQLLVVLVLVAVYNKGLEVVTVGCLMC
jgi:hypothetical protein